VTAEENDLLLDTEQILPAPAIRGRMKAVHMEGDEVAQVFSTVSGTAMPTRRTPSISTSTTTSINS
jgi:hypothetical protein